MDYRHIEVEPIAAALGAEIIGVDTSASMSIDVADEIREALDQYLVTTRPEFTCRFRWAPGSIAVWDNRFSLHLGVNDYDGHRRCMYRTSTAGEIPLRPGEA